MQTTPPIIDEVKPTNIYIQAYNMLNYALFSGKERIKNKGRK